VDDTALFLKRILEHPDDDAPRLVFADWLEERGDPRGEFIRLQCALAAGTGDEAVRQKMLRREQELLAGHWNTWGAKPFRGIADRCRFRRGFIEQIAIAADRFIEHGADLFEWAPLRRIRIFDLNPEQTNRFANCPALKRVVELDLTGLDLHDDGIEHLLRSPHLHQLRWLNLSVNGLSDRAWGMIVRSSALPGLGWLDVSHNHLRELPGALALPNLKTLDFSHNECSGAAMVKFATAKLSRLRILGNPLGDEYFSEVLHKYHVQLVIDGELNLADCGLGPQSAVTLAASPVRRALHTIKWEHNAIGDEGLIAWSRAAGFDRLTRLELAANGITDRGALALAKSPLFRQLQHLDLRRNQMSRDGIEALWSHEHRPVGSTLLLGDNMPPVPPEETLPADAPLPVAEDE
jgi:uncharacterized protein (TIGR02996 family)